MQCRCGGQSWTLEGTRQQRKKHRKHKYKNTQLTGHWQASLYDCSSHPINNPCFNICSVVNITLAFRIIISLLSSSSCSVILSMLRFICITEANSRLCNSWGMCPSLGHGFPRPYQPVWSGHFFTEPQQHIELIHIIKRVAEWVL